MRKIINHHIEGGTRESHPRVQDLQHPRLDKPRRGLQILDTWMGFPRPSLNVVFDSISPGSLKRTETKMPLRRSCRGGGILVSPWLSVILSGKMVST